MKDGFKILDMKDMGGWRVFDVADLGEYTANDECINGGKMKPIISLVGKQRIDIGCCDACGHISYIHKPTQEAINKYYKEVWQDDRVEETMRVAKIFAQSVDKPELADTMKALNQWKEKIESLNLPKDSNVLDIGCGLGRLLWLFKEMGFENTVGIENSEIRVRACRAVYSHVMDGRFEETIFFKNYNLITCQHVLEHVHDPNAFMAKCAEIQNEGDYMMFSMPNQVGEPSVGITLFYPHLHSFTRTSLKYLFERHGYEIVDAGLSVDFELVYLVRKSSLECRNTCVNRFETSHTAYEYSLKKLRKGLGLSREEKQFLIWERDFEGAIIADAEHISIKSRTTNQRNMVIEPLTEKLTDTPIEIHYQDKLFYK